MQATSSSILSSLKAALAINDIAAAEELWLQAVANVKRSELMKAELRPLLDKELRSAREIATLTEKRNKLIEEGNSLRQATRDAVANMDKEFSSCQAIIKQGSVDRERIKKEHADNMASAVTRLEILEKEQAPVEEEQRAMIASYQALIESMAQHEKDSKEKIYGRSAVTAGSHSVQATAKGKSRAGAAASHISAKAAAPSIAAVKDYDKEWTLDEIMTENSIESIEKKVAALDEANRCSIESHAMMKEDYYQQISGFIVQEDQLQRELNLCTETFERIHEALKETRSKSESKHEFTTSFNTSYMKSFVKMRDDFQKKVAHLRKNYKLTCERIEGIEKSFHKIKNQCDQYDRLIEAFQSDIMQIEQQQQQELDVKIEKLRIAEAQEVNVMEMLKETDSMASAAASTVASSSSLLLASSSETTTSIALSTAATIEEAVHFLTNAGLKPERSRSTTTTTTTAAAAVNAIAPSSSSSSVDG